MFILETNCQSPLYSVLLYPLKNIMTVILIAAPILLMISLAIILTKLVISPQDTDRKISKQLFNSVNALLILFSLSVVTNVVMMMCGSRFTFSECWNNAKKVKNPTKYYDVYEKETKKKELKNEVYKNGTDTTNSNNSKNVTSSSVSIPKNALTKNQAESLFNSMKVPKVSEIEELAYNNYGMGKKDVERMIALAANEGYHEDPYFAYLCDSTILNIYLDNKSDIDSGKKNLIHVWGGADTSYDDHILADSKNFDSVRMNGAKKGVYLACKNLNTDAYGCDGVSDYTPYGGEVIYQSEVYTNYPFRVWKIPH